MAASLAAKIPSMGGVRGPLPAGFLGSLLAGCLLVDAVLLSGCAATTPAPAGLSKAIWISRYDWRTAEDIRRAISRSSELGCRSVLFQVRGNGTVCYPSRLEVWSEAFDFDDPGFDPLAVAADAAAAHGMRLHAWINLLPGWRGARPPDDPRQLYNSRPDWFLGDAHGQREPLGGSAYLGLNPCLPRVRAYLAGICDEVARMPGVAGIHLDYVRLTSGDTVGIDHFPADPETLDLFRRATGLDGRTHAADFRRWKADCVTELVREIHRQLQTLPRPPLLSAAVLADAELALTKTAQDWTRWAQEGLIDVLVPMNYTDDDALFAARTRAAVLAASGRSVVVGVGVYKHADGAQTRRQLDLAGQAGAAGVALFGYGELAKPERADAAAAVRDWQHAVPAAPVAAR